MSPKRRIVPVFVPHLGCPHDCVFCSQHSITGSHAPASPREVTEALAGARAVSAEAELAFYGGSFTAVKPELQRALLEAAQPFRRSGFVTSIRVSTRPDAISPGALALLRSYGVETVELGAQSMDDRVLACCGRGHTAAQTEQAAAQVQASGCSLILQMMTGLPGADAASDQQTAAALIRLRPQGVRIYPTVILRGTPLEQLWRQGRYRAHTVQDAVDLCAPIAEAFLAAGIPIIRLGLQPTEALSGGEALAGAYHPALGELVYGRLYLDRARALLRALQQAERRLPRAVELLTAPQSVSRLTGRKQGNLLALRAEFGLEALRVRASELPEGSLAIGTVRW